MGIEQLTEEDLILAEDIFVTTNDTFLNNNVLVYGSPGSGKSMSYVLPNLLQANASYIVTDVKGSLYRKTRKHLEQNGYDVFLLDLKSIRNSSCHYNPFAFIEKKDIVGIRKFSRILVGEVNYRDPFWDYAAETLLTSVIAYLMECCPPSMQNFKILIELLNMGFKNDEEKNTELENLFLKLELRKSNSFAVQEFKKVRGPKRTWNSVLMTAYSKVGMLENPELNKLTMSNDIDFKSIGDRKTAIFVNISDTDKSMQPFVNLFFSQCLQQLCEHADHDFEEQKLPVAVRFLMDDFGNIFIPDFPQIVSTIRSRNISASIILQAESMLESNYKNDYATILSAMDTTLYFGGNDLRTAESIAKRMCVPVSEILYQSPGKVAILRRAEKPKLAERFQMEEHQEYFNFRKKRKQKDKDIADSAQKRTLLDLLLR